MKVISSKFAILELGQFLEYIASKSPTGAERTRAAKLRVDERIAEIPLAAPKVANLHGVHCPSLVRLPDLIY